MLNRFVTSHPHSLETFFNTYVVSTLFVPNWTKIIKNPHGNGGGWTSPLARKHAPAWNALKVGHEWSASSTEIYKRLPRGAGEGQAKQTEPAAACFDRWNEDNK